MLRKRDLAVALCDAECYQEALEICLSLVELDNSDIGNQAKEMMIRIFDKLGNTSELTHLYRRKLASAVY
jgi:thioredoxin-like negative regulator of GroEL